MAAGHNGQYGSEQERRHPDQQFDYGERRERGRGREHRGSWEDSQYSDQERFGTRGATREEREEQERRFGRRGYGERGQGSDLERAQFGGLDYGEPGYERGSAYDRDGPYDRDDASFRSRSGQGRYSRAGYAQGGYGPGGFEERRQRQSAGHPGYPGEENRDWSRARDRRRGFGSYGFGGYEDAYGGFQQGARSEYERPFGWNRGFDRDAESSWRGRESRYFGRGPKGYQRSDERIREDVCDRLTADPEIDASQLTVEVKNREVTLEGTVDDRQMKRRAEDCAEDISGVSQVHNRLRIRPAGEHDSEHSTSRGAGGKHS